MAAPHGRPRWIKKAPARTESAWSSSASEISDGSYVHVNAELDPSAIDGLLRAALSAPARDDMHSSRPAATPAATPPSSSFFTSDVESQLLEDRLQPTGLCSGVASSSISGSLACPPPDGTSELRYFVHVEEELLEYWDGYVAYTVFVGITHRNFEKEVVDGLRKAMICKGGDLFQYLFVRESRVGQKPDKPICSCQWKALIGKETCPLGKDKWDELVSQRGLVTRPDALRIWCHYLCSVRDSFWEFESDYLQFISDVGPPLALGS